MKLPIRQFSIPLCAALAALAAPIGTSAPESESLHYSVNWPSGLSLGEAQMSASTSQASADAEPRLHLAFDLDAGIPGFAVSDRYHSEASPDYCAVEFQRTATHGSKKIDDKTTFDAHEGTATRVTPNGGKTEFESSSCSRDALTYLYFVRHELSQGRFPPPQSVYFGASYEVKLDLDGTQAIPIAGKQQEADHFTAHLQGPASNTTVELFFLKDPARTLALVRVPFALGTFSMELVK